METAHSPAGAGIPADVIAAATRWLDNVIDRIPILTDGIVNALTLIQATAKNRTLVACAAADPRGAETVAALCTLLRAVPGTPATYDDVCSVSWNVAAACSRLHDVASQIEWEAHVAVAQLSETFSAVAVADAPLPADAMRCDT